MITMMTGLPGNGKTLFALWFVNNKAVKEGREVYYHNIKDLNLSWTVFDPEHWMDLPHGSLIVIDECQDVFPKKPNGSKLPDFYSELAKHRHRGFDIFLITQHPSLVDNFVRQLVGQHFHSVRKFGMNRATIYEWSAANPLPQSPASQKSAVPMKWAYPKEVYTWYKSAEVHTVKRAVPAKLILAALFVVAVVSAGYFALDHFQSRGDKMRAQAGLPPAQALPGPSTNNVGYAAVDPIEEAREYLRRETPRLVGLPHTAPKYDELTQPSRVPVPAACIQRGDRRSSSSGAVSCKCYSQQGTPMSVEYNMCVEFANNGYFQDFDAEPAARREARTAASVAALSSKPDAATGPTVLAFAKVPDDYEKPTGLAKK